MAEHPTFGLEAIGGDDPWFQPATVQVVRVSEQGEEVLTHLEVGAEVSAKGLFLRFSGPWVAYAPLAARPWPRPAAESERALREIPLYLQFANIRTPLDAWLFAMNHGPLGLAYQKKEGQIEPGIGPLGSLWMILNSPLPKEVPAIREPVADWLHVARSLRLIIVEATRAGPDANWGGLAAVAFPEPLRPYMPELTVVAGRGGPRAVWRVRTLFQAIYTMMILRMTAGEHRRIRECARPGCGNLFVAVHPRAAYCSPYCQRSQRNRRYYERSKRRVVYGEAQPRIDMDD